MMQFEEEDTNIKTIDKRNAREKYQDFFGLMPHQVRRFSKSQIEDQIQDGNIIYDEAKYQGIVKIEIVSHSLNFKIMVLAVRLGYFSFQVSIINEPVLSRAHLIEKYVFRNSQYYMTSGEEQAFAMKCFPLDKKNPLNQLGIVLREYCYYRIAAALNIGPALMTPFGFDIIICEGCIQFAIEQGQPIHRSPKFWKNSLEDRLKQKLRILHSVGIVHSNIHPKNILYSQKKTDIFFSDYGCARFLNQEDVGMSVQTEVVGHLNYSSDEMIKVFKKQQQNADLFLNDMISLDLSIKEINRQIQKAKDKHFNKDTWEINLGDLLGEQMTLYHNLSKTQPKLKEGYQYMYQYFDMIKVFKDIYQNNVKNLDKTETVKFISEHAQEMKKNIKEFKYSECSKKIQSILQNSTIDRQTDQMRVESYYQQNQDNFFQKMKISVSKIIHKTEDDEINMIINDQLRIKIANEFKKSFETPLKFNQDRRVIILHQEMITKIGRIQYFGDFINFVDLRKLNSTFRQKIKACQFFIKTQHILQKRALQQAKQFQKLQICLKHILLTQLQRPSNFCQELIPKAIANLLIIDSAIDLYSTINSIKLLKINSIQKLIILFKIYCAVDFINFRALSIKDHLKTVEYIRKMIFEALSDLRQFTNDKIICIFVMVLASDTGASIEEEKINDIVAAIGQLQGQGVIDHQTAKQMVSMSVINSIFKQKITVSRYKGMKNILQTFDNTILSQTRINFYHLRLYGCLYEAKIDDELRINIYENFQTCFQDSKIISKFKLYYSEERLSFKTKEIPNSIKMIQNIICTNKKIPLNLQLSEEYKFNRQIVYEWLYYIRWLIDNEQQEICSFYVSIKLKDYYSKESLDKIDFPQNSKNNDFLSFYQTAYAIVKLYILLYRGDKPYKPKKQFKGLKAEQMSKRVASRIITNFLNQLQRNYQAINFQGSDQIKSVIRHFINYIQIQKYILQQKPQQVKRICEEGLSLVVRSNFVSKQEEYIYIINYLSKLLSISFDKNIRVQRQSYLYYAFKNIRKLKVLNFVLNHHFNYKILWFVNFYLLVSNRQKTFIKMHHKLLRILNEDPMDEKVNAYCKSLEDILQQFKDQIKTNIPSIIKLIFHLRIANHCFSPLLLSCSLRYLPRQQSQIFIKVHKKIIQFAQDLSKQAKRIVFANFFECYFSNILKEQISKNKMRRINFEMWKYAKLVLDDDKLQKILNSVFKKQKDVKKFKKKKQGHEHIYKLFDNKLKQREDKHFEYEYEEDEKESDSDDD